MFFVWVFAALLHARFSATNVWSPCSLTGPAKNWVKFFWGSRLLSGMMLVLALPGAVPVMGGFLDPSVSRSPGASPQASRAAHGPRHPAVTSVVLPVLLHSM